MKSGQGAPPPAGLSRRGLLVGLAVGAGAVLSGALAWFWRGGATDSAELGPSVDGAQTLGGAGVLPAAYRTTLAALCARLLPDDGDGLSSEALGVMVYVESALAGLEGPRRLVMRGAAQLDKVSRQKGGKSFVQASEAEQDAVIAAMAAGEGSGPRFSSTDFLRTMMGLVLEGALADPRHGGNRDQGGWRAIGYAMHPPMPGACGHASCE